MVAYETINTITNQGPPMTKEKGLVSIWILSMLNASPKTVIIVPYKSGDEQQLGPVVKSDYFGTIPPERLKITPEAILFSADANYRSKIGTSQKRGKNTLGEVDFQANVLTLANFTMPEDPTKARLHEQHVGQAEPSRTGRRGQRLQRRPAGAGQEGPGRLLRNRVALARDGAEDGRVAHPHSSHDPRPGRPGDARQIAKQTLGVDLAKVRKEMAVP